MGGQPQDSEHTGGDNVIRFPRDWFGSKEDLIPIGSAADRLEEAAAAAEREHTAALSADDFWGEAAGALHQAVDVPRCDDEVALAPVEELDVRREARAGLSARSPRRTGARVPRASRLALPRAALLFAALVLGASGLFLSGELGASRGHAGVAGRETAARLRSNHAPLSRSHAEMLAAAGQALNPELTEQARPVNLAFAKKAKAASKAKPRHSERTKIVHARQSTQKTRHPATRSSTRSTPAAEAAVVTPTSSYRTPAPSSGISNSYGTSGGPSPTSVGNSAPQSSVLTDLGEVVGSTCNPTCR